MTMRSIRQFFRSAALATALALPLAASAQVAPEPPADPDPVELTQEQMGHINSLVPLFMFASQNHVLEPTIVDLMNKARECAPGTVNEWEIFDCTLKSLDPHSGYISPDELQGMQEAMQGSFAGIGVSLQFDEDEGTWDIVGFPPNSPSQAAGVEEGDKVTHIDGQSVEDLGPDESIGLFRGDEGTDVTITVQREGEAAPIEITITRAIIEFPVVESRQIDDNIGYVRLYNFVDENAQEDVRAAVLDHIDNMGDDFAGLVLDLRGNGGGLTQEAIALLDDFIESGVIVSFGKDPQNPNDQYTATPGDLINGKPLVVLVDGGSASASELVSGTLQDTDRATIIGTQSFGKGSQHVVVPLTNGGGLQLTTDLFFTPSGESIHGRGVVPDITVVSDADTTDFMREADLDAALINRFQQDTQSEATCDIRDDLTAADLTDEDLLNGFGEPDEALVCAVEFINGSTTDVEFTPVNDNAPEEGGELPALDTQDRQRAPRP